MLHEILDTYSVIGNEIKRLYIVLLVFNSIAEIVRLQFPSAHELVNNSKAIFVKASLRVDLFKETLPDTHPCHPSRW